MKQNDVVEIYSFDEHSQFGWSKTTPESHMDDKQISYALADNGDSWNLGFTYIHSTHRVVITEGVNQSQPTQTPTSTPTSAVDEFNILPITLFFIIALAAVSLIIVGLKRKNPITPNSC